MASQPQTAPLVPSDLVAEVVQRGGRILLRGRLATGSMAPLLPVGTEVTIDAGPLTPRPGQVLAFRDKTDSKLIVHRLHRILPDGQLQLMGDALPRPDAPLAPADLLGRVVAARRPDGRELDLNSRALRLAGRLLIPTVRLRGLLRVARWKAARVRDGLR